MTYRELYNVIDDCCNDITFSYNGQKCGIESEVKDDFPMTCLLSTIAVILL